MSDIAPLTPPDCDLTDFRRMMLDIGRLRGSSFDATLNDSAWRAGLNLWMSSWHQVPAASLEDNEAELTKAAGLGRDVKTFRKLRAEAMRGWVKCSDGLLYHETVAEIALEAWIDKLGQRISSGAGNAKRHKIEFDPAPIYAEVKVAAGKLASLNQKSKHLSKPHVIRAIAGVPPEFPPGDEAAPTGNPVGSQEKGREGTIIESPKPPSGAFVQADFDQAWNAYPEEGRATTSRELSLNAWKPVAAEVGSAELLAAVKAFAASPVVKGPKAKSVPNFALWLRKGRFETYLGKPAGGVVLRWNGPDEIWRKAVKAFGEPGAVSYLGRATWQEVPERAVLAATGEAAAKLEAADLGVPIIRPKTGRAA